MNQNLFLSFSKSITIIIILKKDYLLKIEVQFNGKFTTYLLTDIFFFDKMLHSCFEPQKTYEFVNYIMIYKYFADTIVACS